MAERRMFAKTIIDSDAFLDMPLSSQALYFHLSMRADDDGFVNSPKKIARLLGCGDDDARLLLAKKFIISFESGVIVIKHWKIHNYIQKDRYKGTNYHEEMGLLYVDKNNGYTLDTENIQNGDSGKVRVSLEKEKEKGEREEIPHTPFSFQEEIKIEPKPVINQDLKSMISKQAKSENKVTDIINYYRDNISSRNEDIQEVASYNQILIKNYDMDKMMVGLGNYKRFLEVSKKAPMKLFFFIRDAIYNDYQVENVVSTGKNIAVVPVDLVGKRFIIQGEEIEFENDGYNKVGKDWKVTNGKNVEEMVRLARSVV